MSVLVQVFAKYPQTGKVKTRLIPAVGEKGAADLQIALLDDLLWRLHGSVELELWGTDSAAKPHYQSLINQYHLGFRRQTEGDLGVRMEKAFASAFLRGRMPLLVGADCPAIDIDLIDAMTEELEMGADAVMVPANDGGYVALGLAVKNYQLFRGIKWGSKHVADQTLEAMFNTGMECSVFEPVADIDYMKDVQKCKKSIDQVNDAELCKWIEQYL